MNQLIVTGRGCLHGLGALAEELREVRVAALEITFPGITDIRGLDIPSIVHLDIGEVLVYPDSDTKPPPGEGLNRQATITLYQCWPSDDHTQLLNPTKAEKYRNKIKAMTEKKNAHFLDYDCSTGVWMFQVEQF